MTTENLNLDPEEMTDEQLEAAQRAADGETADTNPAANDDPAQTDAADDAAAAQAATDAEAAAATATTAAAGADAAADTSTNKIEGIASKDGNRILPFSALQAERRSARTANARAEALSRELEEAQKLIADMKAGKTPESGEVTEEDVRAMEEEFPEHGKKMRALFEAAKAAPPAKTAASAEADVGEDPVQEAIDQVPLLLKWQHEDAEKFNRAQEHDNVLINSPKWRDKPAVERFAEAVRLTADEYDIPVPQAKPSTPATPSPAQKAAAAPRAAPNTLSDFKGGAVADHGTADIKNMGTQQLLNRFMDMTDAEMDAQLARLG